MATNGRVGAIGLRDLIVDDGTWESWDHPPDEPVDADAGYADDLERARERSGCDESVITGVGRVGGRTVVLIVSEFAFLGGSIGAAAGNRVVQALRRATSAGLPVLAMPASGGTRMQEGTPAFLQMVAITGAVTAHKAAGLAYLVYLRHPTTGGVFASWGSLGHVTWAQPGALVGFLGPRVYEGLYGEPFPAGVQTAENLSHIQLVDAVLDAKTLRNVLGSVLGLLEKSGAAHHPSVRRETAVPDVDAWTAVQATRETRRAGVIELLGAGESVILNSGPMRLALSRFGNRVAVVIGQDRAAQADGQLIAARHLRVARRGLAMAADLGLPVITVIDTPGAELSASAEEDGLAAEIARCTAELIDVAVPTVSVLLGQGGGGAALALFPADRRVARHDAWLSPLPPEGASLIVHRDTDHAADLARRQGILAAELARSGVIDELIGPTGDISARIAETVVRQLDSIAGPDFAARTRVPGSGR